MRPFLVPIPVLILEELLRQQPLEVEQLHRRIWLRTRSAMKFKDLKRNLDHMEGQGLILRHKREENLFVHATIKGMRLGQENRETAWKIFPVPEPDSK